MHFDLLANVFKEAIQRVKLNDQYARSSHSIILIETHFCIYAFAKDSTTTT